MFVCVCVCVVCVRACVRACSRSRAKEAAHNKDPTETDKWEIVKNGTELTI